MNVVSLFAGIGGFDLAFERVGAQVPVQVEWDEKCQELLRRKFPGTAIYGDIKEVRGADVGRPDVLVGGFPCQDISIAGGRAGLAGDRSGLWYEFVRLIEETRPRWVIAENVAGLLSSGGRRDMGAVLGTLANLGYGFAYRVLDAQFFGVPQRRRRVFIVADLAGTPDGPREVLLEPEGVPRDPAPSGEAGEIVAALTANGLGGGGPDDNLAQAGHIQPVILRQREGKPGGGKGPLLSDDKTLTLATNNDQYLFQPVQRAIGQYSDPDVARSVTSRMNRYDADTDPAYVVGEPVPVALRGRPEATLEYGESGDPAFALRTGNGGSSKPMVAQPAEPVYAVRRLTPLECERLQGFPDGWTEGFADTVRYRMLGNAVAVPVVEWIARRLKEVDDAR